MTLSNGELRVRSLRDVVSAMQQRLRGHVAEGASLSDELIADRRAQRPVSER